MNKEQIEMLFKAVKTDVELARLTGEYHYFSRAIEGLKRLKKVKLERILNSPEFKIEKEKALWNL